MVIFKVKNNGSSSAASLPFGGRFLTDFPMSTGSWLPLPSQMSIRILLLSIEDEEP